MFGCIDPEVILSDLASTHAIAKACYCNTYAIGNRVGSDQSTQTANEQEEFTVLYKHSIGTDDLTTDIQERPKINTSNYC